MSTTASVAERIAASDEFEIRIARGFEELATLWPAPRASQEPTDFYSTLAWFETLSTFGIEPELARLLIVMRHLPSGSLLCLPLLLRPRASGVPFGHALCSMSNYYSALFGPIGKASLFTPTAATQLVRHLRSQHAVLDLRPLDRGSSFYSALRGALVREGWWVDEYFCFGNWHLEVSGRTYSTYAKTLSSRLRNTVRRGQKKLDGAGAWSIRVIRESGPALEQSIADWQAIYDRSWKVPEPHTAFVPELCRMAARHGWLRLGVLQIGETPVAAQIWLIRDGQAQIFKLAYDEEFKHYSAGSVLSAELMRRAIDEDAVIDVDYLIGDDAYKADWMSHRRERVGLIAFDPRALQGVVAAVRHFAGRWTRRWRGRRRTQVKSALPVPAAKEAGDHAPLGQSETA